MNFMMSLSKDEAERPNILAKEIPVSSMLEDGQRHKYNVFGRLCTLAAPSHVEVGRYEFLESCPYCSKFLQLKISHFDDGTGAILFIERIEHRGVAAAVFIRVSGTPLAVLLKLIAALDSNGLQYYERRCSVFTCEGCHIGEQDCADVG